MSPNKYDPFCGLDQTANHTYQPKISSAQNKMPSAQENTEAVLKTNKKVAAAKKAQDIEFRKQERCERKVRGRRRRNKLKKQRKPKR